MVVWQGAILRVAEGFDQVPGLFASPVLGLIVRAQDENFQNLRSGLLDDTVDSGFYMLEKEM